MQDAEQLIADVIAVHGGELVGRIRIQKVIYLLDQLGLNSGFEYGYHHYGPYSSELSSALLDGRASGLINDVVKYRQSDGAAYSVYQTAKAANAESVGDLPRDKAEALVQAMKGETATVLEIAATIHWLREVEKVEDWSEELSTRKGSKVAEGRKERALALLGQLGL